MTAKKRVLLTGASGSMGNAAFGELLGRKDQYDIVLLLRPSKPNKKAFRQYEGGKGTPVGERGVVEHDGVKIVWGDLTRYDDVVAAVEDVDFVLHPAAMIAPAADHNPEMAGKINTGGTENLVAAIKARPDKRENVRIVYVGTVAEYGDRLPPIHMIRTGDPLKPSIFDFYATTKIRAERAVIESGLKHWVSMRQTYIAIPDAMSLMDPIMFHQPINTCLELITNRDAGYGLVQCLECPDDFYGRVYNMGGGPDCRFVFTQYLDRMMDLFSMGDYQKIMDRSWFALRNFHCGWFADSFVLNDYLGHWRDSLEDHYRQVLDAAPWYTGLGKFSPKSLVKQFYMKPMASGKDGPLLWAKENMEARLSAFFGSREAWEAIPGWDEAPVEENPGEGERFDHGYDEDKPIEALTLDDMRGAADFRGGECLSDAFAGMGSALRWKCAFGHVFDATPTLVLKAGHWCPECLAPPWNFDEIARKNRFFAQVYYNNHDSDESNFYDERCYEDIL